MDKLTLLNELAYKYYQKKRKPRKTNWEEVDKKFNRIMEKHRQYELKMNARYMVQTKYETIEGIVTYMQDELIGFETDEGFKQTYYDSILSVTDEV